MSEPTGDLLTEILADIPRLIGSLIGLASPIMGIIRGNKNAAPLHVILSLLIPLYGLVYFFVAKRDDDVPNTEPQSSDDWSDAEKETFRNLTNKFRQ